MQEKETYGDVNDTPDTSRSVLFEKLSYITLTRQIRLNNLDVQAFPLHVREMLLTSFRCYELILCDLVDSK